jgi:hypothetical protein
MAGVKVCPGGAEGTSTPEGDAMAQDFGYSGVTERAVETRDGRSRSPEPDEPVLRITFDGFYRVTGEELRTPLKAEREARLIRGLASLDSDFPNWLREVEGETADSLVLRFRDVEAVRNVASKLRDRGLEDRPPEPGSRYHRGGAGSQAEPHPHLLSLSEAANRKGVPTQDLRRAIEAGELEASTEGSEHFIHAADLEEWTPHAKPLSGSDFTDAEAAEYLRTPGTPS